MPHYVNNREAKEGDFVIYQENLRFYHSSVPQPSIPPKGSVKAGRIHLISISSNTCNAQLIYAGFNGNVNVCVTLGDCLHVEDALALFEKQE